MEVHVINCYGKDPFVSTGKRFTLNIHNRNRYHEAHYVLKKRFRIPEPIEVEFKSFFSDGRSYENF
ncbi:hypothetical protein EQO05_10460 [Methanosarcina sp. MSH10X1]|uniref:hypothetical protein n=1 Tax=Methanosarcina sp. MSH10X1 TaxID=2507075 RepID=UPI000FFC76B5|nr:hypothetical protein [Methanosarcina sp. MSH10X1]RXA18727.1 hypothetical protein EQO05_10460 [Methanosarcina sp. MSH10X1]